MLMHRQARFAPESVRLALASAAELDAVVEAADPAHGFLRAVWAEAAAPDLVAGWVAWRGDGSPLAALPLVRRKVGPLAVKEVAGCYWPFRSFPIAADASVEELVSLLSDPDLPKVVGRVWRLGPVFDNDPSVALLRMAAPLAGWTMLTRQLGTCYEIDVAALRSEGPWPRPSTMKKNRWRERKLSEIGRLAYASFTGSTWTGAERDALAEIERHSWLAKLEGGAALHFADSVQRRFWEQVASDPLVAPMLFGTILSVGGVPAAFAFGMQVGSIRYNLANNYDERFAEHSAGRTVLIRDFEQAVAAGVERISWGSGDAGYKTDMGARPGPEILDLLLVRSRALAAVIRRRWR